MRFRRCDVCDSIAVFSRPGKDGTGELSCAAHVTGDGWARVCSATGCDRPPKFKVEYRVGDKLARLTACPEHFQFIPEDISEVFRID